jgi:hypothetical protein
VELEIIIDLMAIAWRAKVRKGASLATTLAVTPAENEEYWLIHLM